MPHPIAYLPLNTYPECPSDAATLATLAFARTLGCSLHVATFSVEIPPVASPLGGFLINVEGMARAAEDRSRADCERLRALVEAAAKGGPALRFTHHQPVMGAATSRAALDCRYDDLALLPWTPDSVAAQDMAQALIFGAGVPVVLVPEATQVGPVTHIAVAWDESRVAARALNDALRLVADGTRVTVLTVQDEKSLNGPGIAEDLAAALERRGHPARALNLTLAGKPISVALQEAAIREGAQLLAMGGFGHSRLRDFVLGGATQGLLADLRLPTLLAH